MTGHIACTSPRRMVFIHDNTATILLGLKGRVLPPDTDEMRGMAVERILYISCYCVGSHSFLSRVCASCACSCVRVTGAHAAACATPISSLSCVLPGICGAGVSSCCVSLIAASFGEGCSGSRAPTKSHVTFAVRDLPATPFFACASSCTRLHKQARRCELSPRRPPPRIRFGCSSVCYLLVQHTDRRRQRTMRRGFAA